MVQLLMKNKELELLILIHLQLNMITDSGLVLITPRPSVVGLFCFVAPHGFTFLYEGSDPFLSVSQSQVVDHHLGGGGICGISALSHLSLGEHKHGSVCVSDNL